MINQEFQVIKADGFECLIVGDLNGHVGNDEEGISNNLPSVNFNGTLIRDFVSSSNMHIVNADESRCCGLYTRVTANSISCLDYVLENKEHNTVSSMKVDVNSEVLGRSDHSAIFIELCATKVVLDPMEESAPPIPNPTSQTVSAYSQALDNILASLNWNNMDIDEKCSQFQGAAVKAALTSCPAEAPRAPVSSSRAI